MNNQIDDSMKNQVAALLRVINVTRFLKGDDVPCQIEEGLFLGSVGAATNKDALNSKNITHILTVANSLPPSYPNDFVYEVIGVADRNDTNLRQYFDKCFNFIDEAKRQGGGVLVHCFVGRSRSVTIVVAYLMKRNGMRLSEALAHVKSKRPQAGPNSGFISQLQDFEKSLQGALSLILLYVVTCKLYLMWLVLVIQKKKIIIALIEVSCLPLISFIKTFKFKPKFVSGIFFVEQLVSIT